MPAHVINFILRNSKGNNNNIIRKNDGFKTKSVCFSDTDSLNFEQKHCDVLDKGKLVGEYLSQGENNCKNDGIFYGLFLAPKIKYYPTIDKYALIEGRRTLKSFTDSQRLLERNQYFEMLKVYKMYAKLPESWKKGSDSGIVIPKEAIYCTDCKKVSSCSGCDKKINQLKKCTEFQ